MFAPKYQLSSSLLTHISQAERWYGQLESLAIPTKYQLNVERQNLVKSAYISNSIEGNPLSLPEVTNLLSNERKAVNRDELEVRNYFQILKKLPELETRPLDLRLITDLHKELMTGVDNSIAGKIRDTRVVVGKFVKKGIKRKLLVKHEPPFHSRRKIEAALKDLLKWVSESSDVHPLLKIGIFHHQYLYIHPFMDGNGRTCRLLTALLLQKQQYAINKYFVLDDYYDLNRPMYSDKLSSADAGDQTAWLEYFTSGVSYSLESALGRIKTMIRQLPPDQRPTPKEQQILEMLEEQEFLRVADILARHDISRQQGHRLLQALVEKGFAKKSGITKNSYYTLK